METHPRFQEFVKCMREKGVAIFRVFVEMGWNGAESPKPTWLYSTHECLKNIKKYAISESNQRKPLVTKKRDSTGKLCITGNTALKSSQAYPPAFGAAVAQLYADNKDALHKRSMDLLDAAAKLPGIDTSDLPARARSEWPDAKLDGVFELLGGL